MGSNQSFDGYEELTRIGYDLMDLYPEQLNRAYCREEQVERVREVLFQQDTPACLSLIGPRGSGKSTIIQSALLSMLEKHAPDARQKVAKLWYLDPLRIISGMSIVGMWQKRVDAILSYLINRKKSSKKNILYIDNPVALFRIGKSAQNALTIADVIKPVLEKRSMGMLLETSPEQWEKIQEYDRRFADLFHVIRIDSPSEYSGINMLNQVRIGLERQYGCVFEQQAMAQVWRLSSYYSVDKTMPGAAVDVLQQLASHTPGAIKAEHVLNYYAQARHFNPVLLDDNIKLSDDDLFAFLNSHLVGQATAKKTLCDVIQCIKAKVNDGGKPLSSLLFIGPTGVGKTEAAKVLCKYLFVSNKHLVRFDMNEYVDPGAVNRLIGDEYQPNGQLTSQVRHHKACVLLLDEIEKAHPAVHNLLLQLLGEARLTDALGRTTDFSQTVVIMTSNLGAVQANRQVGFMNAAADRGHTYREAVQRYFPPEFVNRIDRTVVFDQLQEADIQQISTIMLQKLLKREGLQRRTSFLKINREALYKVASEAYEPSMGARALKRNIEKSLVAMAARHLAELPPDQQVILEVGIVNKRLQILFQPIQYPQKLTCVFDRIKAMDLVAAYPLLEQQIECLLDRVHNQIDRQPENKIALWTLIESIRDLQRSVKKICWDIESWRETPINRGHFKLAGTRSLKDWSLVSEKSSDWNQLFHNVIDITKLSTLLDPVNEIVNSQYLSHVVSCESLALFIEQMMDSESSEYCFEINSLIERSGGDAIKKLADWYGKILRYFGIDVRQEKISDDQIKLLVKGNGFIDFFRQEQGIHLFEIDAQVTVPVELKFIKSGETAEVTAAKTLPVVRYYQMLYSSEVMLDFRSGMYCTRFPESFEFFLIYFNSLVKQAEIDYA